MEQITFEDVPRVLAEISRKLDRLLSNQASTKEEPDKLMSLEEFRHYLPECPARQTLYGWVNDRKVPFEKHGSRLYFRKSLIDRWLDEGRPDQKTMKS